MCDRTVQSPFQLINQPVAMPSMLAAPDQQGMPFGQHTATSPPESPRLCPTGLFDLVSALAENLRVVSWVADPYVIEKRSSAGPRFVVAVRVVGREPADAVELLDELAPFLSTVPDPTGESVSLDLRFS